MNQTTKTSGLLAGKRVLITGVLTPKSIAYVIAEAAIAEGAEVILTSFGRAMSLTERSAKRLPTTPRILNLDVTSDEDFIVLEETLKADGVPVSGLIHAIGYAPEEALGGAFLTTPWKSVALSLQISSYSLAALSRAVAPMMTDGGSIVSLTFDGTVAWPIYDWMGPAKAALESISRYLARDLGGRGIRVNTIAAGPLDTVAAKSIPAFAKMKKFWNDQAPLDWDTADATPVADTAIFLLSHNSRAITGEIIHVDGGYHALGAPLQGHAE